MANMLELLLSDDALDTPEKAAATAAALRRQQKLGTLGTLMGVAPTQQVGAQLQEGAQTSLRAAMAKQQAAKESAARKAERELAQQNWQAEQAAQAARHREQMGLQWSQEKRQREQAERDAFQIVPDPVYGGFVRFNKKTGESEPVELSNRQVPGAGAGPRQPGFQDMPPGLKLTETQEKSRGFAQRMAGDVPIVEGLLAGGYEPNFKDFSLKMSTLNNPLVSAYAEKGMSEEGRKFFNASSKLVNAILRKESGAAITEYEWARAFADWLPRPGDSPEERQRKANNLRAEMDSMAQGAGPASRFWQPPESGVAPTMPQAQGMSQPTAPQGPRPGDKYLSNGG
jgi:hypothetical protein